MYAGDRSESGNASEARVETGSDRSCGRRAVLAAVGAGTAALAALSALGPLFYLVPALLGRVVGARFG
ncbi:hypothetical protein [Natronomonas sp.]|jgi:hypothetical protein|uniref:hypothetical protein n=1 Tax=Natronomonas sp. TaxID=2184060 RepID=UPI00398941E8